MLYLPLEFGEIKMDGLVDSGAFINAMSWSDYNAIKMNSDSCVIKEYPQPPFKIECANAQLEQPIATAYSRSSSTCRRRPRCNPPVASEYTCQSVPRIYNNKSPTINNTYTCENNNIRNDQLHEQDKIITRPAAVLKCRGPVCLTKS